MKTSNLLMMILFSWLFVFVLGSFFGFQLADKTHDVRYGNPALELIKGMFHE